MRTTVTLADDVARAVEQLRRERGIGVSRAIDSLIRQGLAAGSGDAPRFRQRTSPMGTPIIPLDDVAGALDALEGDARRE